MINEKSLAIVRMNPMHKGHEYLCKEMGKVSDVVYIGLGSSQEEKTLKNPYSPKQREIMVRNVFPDKKKYVIFFLEDLGSCSPKEWQDYCLDELLKQCGKDANPTMYFGGCSEDVVWWKDAKNKEGQDIKCVALCRDENEHLSATEIRHSLRHFLAGQTMNIKWVKEIPDQNIEFVKENYPKELISKD